MNILVTVIMTSVLGLLPATRNGVKYPDGVSKSDRHFLDFVIDGESLWKKVGKPRDAISVICFDYSSEETVQAVNRLLLTEKAVPLARFLARFAASDPLTKAFKT